MKRKFSVREDDYALVTLVDAILTRADSLYNFVIGHMQTVESALPK